MIGRGASAQQFSLVNTSLRLVFPKTESDISGGGGLALTERMEIFP